MKHRETPNWPTYFAQAAAFAVVSIGPFALQAVPRIQESEHPYGYAIGISAIAALAAAFFVLRFCEWLFNAHMDSIESKNRFGFASMLITFGLFAVAVATFAIQWQKS
ncbi:hypothetical protein G6L33_22330 [Agrobacterium rhizogenes]|uniref:Putative membrane protein n=1 Tax=Rhizobium rhizogenes TaxID=359 RepID=A0A7S4ZTG4_RHIRH|nr:hypothetical protein [Rhizobium rhizogenes]NTH66600.1 hypothetical protein [Rhizobium rhizogenes]NTJ35911.1 hypothetical protein [Rhizobium rhizogenes]QCL09992.1 putative membrane protein [Rhizobium rhizogenes]